MLKKKIHRFFFKFAKLLKNPSHFWANTPENRSPDGLRTSRDHFRGALGPVESDRRNEKVQKSQVRAQTDRRTSAKSVLI